MIDVLRKMIIQGVRINMNINAMSNKLSKSMKISDVLKGVSIDKIRRIKNQYKEEYIDNPFDLLELKDSNGVILRLADIKKNILLDDMEKIEGYISNVILELFNENSKYSYLTENIMLRIVEKKSLYKYIEIPTNDDGKTKEEYEEEKIEFINEVLEYIDTHDEIKYDIDNKMIYSVIKLNDEREIYRGVRKLMEADNPIKDIVLDTDGLDTAQTNAAKKILESTSNIHLLIGDGGTGKSNVVKSVVESVHNVHPDWNIAILTPTGKATTVIGNEYDENVTVATLHSFVGKGRTEEKASIINKIRSMNMIFVDEAGMVSYDVLSKLIQWSDYNNCKIIFTGDDKQLLPVGAGYLIEDLKYIGIEPMVLTKDYRAQNEEIRNNNQFFKKLFTDKTIINTDDEYYGIQTGENVKVMYESKSELYAYIRENYSPDKSLEDINNRIILTHDNRERVEINKMIQEIRNVNNNDCYEDYYKGDKVIITKNHYQSYEKLYYANGQCGYIEDIKGDGEEKYLVIRLNNGETVNIFKSNIYDIDLGYALTIYKAQGSQWKTVDIVLYKHENMDALSMNEFYTAITRAKENMIMWTDKEYLLEQLKKEREKRNTFIPLLCNKYKNTKLEDIPND